MAEIKKTIFKWALDKVWKQKFSPDPEGAPRAKELIMWYFFGKGKPFIRKSGIWSEYMRTRPMIQQAMNTFYSGLAQEICQSENLSGTFDQSVGHVKLMGEAMAITLSTGTVTVKGSYQIKREVGFCNVFFRGQWTWRDRGDLHDGKNTLLDSGDVIEDKTLKKWGEILGGMEFDIEISWKKDMSIHLKIPDKKVLDIRKDKKTGAIIEYHIEGVGWASKSQAIELANAKELDVVLVRSKRGTYLRSKPDNSVFNNFSQATT
ncbi:DUF3892 domain-containing protein [Deltaproteobacteria bacterium TL4]